MISRLPITVAAAINKEKYLPKFMLILLDDELINYLDFAKCGQSPMMGDWIQWLASQIDEMVKTKKSYLPVRAKQDNKPAIYWNALPLHQAWWDNEPRIKYNNVLESIVKTFDNMKIIKIKEIWDPKGFKSGGK